MRHPEVWDMLNFCCSPLWRMWHVFHVMIYIIKCRNMYCCVLCVEYWMIVCLCDWSSLWLFDVLCVVFYLGSLEISSVAALGISVIGPHMMSSF